MDLDDPEADDQATLPLHFENVNLTNQVFFTIEQCLEQFGNETNVPLNVTCIGHAPTMTHSSMIKSFVLSVIAILSLMGNVATMVSIKKSKRHRSGHVYSLIYHLSIADLCVTFWCLLGEAIWYLTVEWKAGNVECKVFKFSQMFSLYLSTFIMVLIGVDRFIAVKYPLKSISKGMCFRLIALCWSLSAALSLPQMVVFHVSQGPFIEPFFQCVTHGFYTAEWQEQLYTTFTLICMFVLPLLILVSTYILTFWSLHRNEEILDHSGSFRTLIDPNRRKLIRAAKMKSLRISVAIVVTFLICWTPYYVMMIISIFINPDNQASEDLQSGIFFFGMSNSLFNPLIYGIFHLRRPARKDLQRYHYNYSAAKGNSSRKTLITNVTSSFYPQRSAMALVHGLTHGNGSMISQVVTTTDGNAIVETETKFGHNDSVKSSLDQSPGNHNHLVWSNGSVQTVNEGQAML